MKTTVTVFTEGTKVALYSNGAIAAYAVKNSSDSTGNLCVQVGKIHPDARYDTLEPGDVRIYRAGLNAINTVSAWKEAEAATVVAVHGEAAWVNG